MLSHKLKERFREKLKRLFESQVCPMSKAMALRQET
jgi:hypothetical protein